MAIVALSIDTVRAGEIAGVTPALLPTLDRDIAFNFSNDFLGRGGSTDDFRTQQTIVSAKVSERWIALVDHSILTLTSSSTPGRVDQLSASLGYSLLHSVVDSGVSSVTVGSGIRRTGKFAGERVQNGFHRLIDSNIDSLPYANTNDTDVTVWLDANRYRGLATFGDWRAAYWLRAATLVTTAENWDGSVNAALVATRGSTDIWLGLRYDWRQGYDADIVQAETARAEEDSAVVIGVRFGALVLETVQQLNNKASYGQIVLVSSGVRSANKYVEPPQYGIEFGFLLPDVELQLAGSKQVSLLTHDSSDWRESVFLETRYGKPQYQNDDTLYIGVAQVSAGLEWEHPIANGVNWLSYYGTVGAGWRREQLNREALESDEKSQSVDAMVITGGAGLRYFATTMGGRWNYRLQLGLTATVPLSDASVMIGNEQFTLQQPGIGMFLGMTFDYL